MRPLAWLAAGLLLLPGCAGQLAQNTSPPATPELEKLGGAEVGRMAEQQLESLHPGMAPGAMTCPDLAFEVGAAVRCVQLAELSAGRRIRVLGTVSVTSTENGGSLHVKLDDAVVEFGVTGTYLARDLSMRTNVAGRPSPRVRCPYLVGVVGTTVRCSVTLGEQRYAVRAEVTAVDPTTNSTTYRFDDEQLRTVLQRSLAYVATEPGPVVD